MTPPIARPALKFFDDFPASQDIVEEVVEGLGHHQKEIPAKFFYDEAGSLLFEAITQLPEYYPTRTEIGLLQQHRHEIAELAGERVWLLEYGSGASTKIRLLLESIKPDCYVPMDISRDFLLASADKLMDDYPWLYVYAACVDYSQPVELPNDMHTGARKLGFFPGSSIGNFCPSEAGEFLKGVADTLGENGALLIGVDLQKDISVLEAAYNDQQGVTAEFNLNLLHHLNRVANANFNPERFSHKAHYNIESHRIEMHLISTMDQVVRVGQHQFGFKQGETIHTENSYKYSYQSFCQLAGKSGFDVEKFWTDENEYFGLFYLKVRG